MTESDYQIMISNHPQKVEVSYKGISTSGVLSILNEKLFQETGSSFNSKTIELTYLTSKLPDINIKTDGNIIIAGNVCKIKSVYKDSLLITILTVEEKYW